MRSRGSLIQSTNGHSNGIVPWLKTLDASVAAVNQGGKRKGAGCVYLEPWHADIEEFLELRDNTGDEARRTHNLNLANWIPDLFMRRVEADGDWSLFDPQDGAGVPRPVRRGVRARLRAGRGAGPGDASTVKARELYARMMRTLAQTGNGWMTFKDKSNRACNQTALPGNVVHLSNLCTEILEVTSADETAVCNLGSINLAPPRRRGRPAFDFDKLAETVRTGGAPARPRDRPQLLSDRDRAPRNLRWRPVGLGVMGLQDVFFQLRLPFDCAGGARAVDADRRRDLLPRAASLVRAGERARRASGASRETRAARGELQFDAWGVAPDDTRTLGRAARSASPSTACATRC